MSHSRFQIVCSIETIEVGSRVKMIYLMNRSTLEDRTRWSILVQYYSSNSTVHVNLSLLMRL